jgi:hypothetical protein
MGQRMGPLPNHRVRLGPIFQSKAEDLFGPIEYQGVRNKRQVGKGWCVMFVCSATSAVLVEFMDTYSTDSFLMAYVDSDARGTYRQEFSPIGESS